MTLEEVGGQAVGSVLNAAHALTDAGAERNALGALAAIGREDALQAANIAQRDGLEPNLLASPTRRCVLSAILALLREDRPAEPKTIQELLPLMSEDAIRAELTFPESVDAARVVLGQAIEALDNLIHRRLALEAGWALAADASNFALRDPADILEAGASYLVCLADRLRARRKFRASVRSSPETKEPT